MISFIIQYIYIDANYKSLIINKYKFVFMIILNKMNKKLLNQEQILYK
jgi:hypothetical protein